MEFDRPKTESEFKEFCWRISKKIFDRETRRYAMEHGGDDAVRDYMPKEMMNSLDGDVLDQIDWLKRNDHGAQFTHVYAQQALERLLELPPTMRNVTLKVAMGADVIEASKEVGIDIVDGMKRLIATRAIMDATAEVEADEKRTDATISPHAVRRSIERYGIDLSARIAQQIAKQIEGGTAKHLSDAANGTKRYEVTVAGRNIPVAYNTVRRHITTVLPQKSRSDA